MMARVVKAPEKLDYQKRIFLSGSIEMGTAERWQDRIEEELKDTDVVILNPRRDHWDSSLEQSIKCPEFAEQVNWELDAMEEADKIFMYFDPNTKSPITLLEFGLYCKSRKLMVCCPLGFWRRGNIEIMCNRYRIPLTDNWKIFISWIKTYRGQV